VVSGLLLLHRPTVPLPLPLPLLLPLQVPVQEVGQIRVLLAARTVDGKR